MASELEKKYQSGNYICCYKTLVEQENCEQWGIIKNPVFDAITKNYRLIHVKHAGVLNKVLEDDSVEINYTEEVNSSSGKESINGTICADVFFREYNENAHYYIDGDEEAVSYPECEKLAKHSDYINGVLEFMEFVGEKGISLVSKHTQDRAIYHDCDLNVHKAEDLLYEMFGIDRKKLEKERDDMLKAYQKSA